ncbi:hypothetical protein ABTM66_19825, partial [Acinetobacter baumannii]
KMRRLCVFLTAALLALQTLMPLTFAQDASKPEEKKAEEKPAELTSKLAVNHLDNPSGIAVNPTTGHIFITSRQGVFRYVP